MSFQTQALDAPQKLVLSLVQTQVFTCVCSDVIYLVPLIEDNLLHSLRYIEPVIDIRSIVLQARQSHLIVGVLAVRYDISKHRRNAKARSVLEPKSGSGFI
jgi:hypothetical protein